MAYTTIKLTRYTPIKEELKAKEIMDPGKLVEATTDEQVQLQDSVGAQVPRMFVMEDELQGHDIGVAYSSGDIVSVGYFRPGDKVLGILASGENVTEGDYLDSDGTGRLQASGGMGQQVVQALEDKDLSETGADPDYIRCRVV